MDGFTILHQRLSADHFSLFSGPSAGEFPVQYIISLTLLVLVGIVVQPHFIATGGGSAKSEDEARIGLVVGNFLKRLCTVGWALTALIALALLAGSPEIAGDTDKVWGVAAREILGPLNLGLVGLMLACLIAAMMSSADTYMIVTSALVVRNVYAPYVDPNASDRKYVLVARMTGLIIIIGASIVAMQEQNVFGQFKMAVELPILFAAPFWIGMYWRRANRQAVWITMGTVLVIFFLLPSLLPRIAPGLRDSAGLSRKTDLVTKTFTRTATPADVAKHEAWTKATENAALERKQTEESFTAQKAELGPEPDEDDANYPSWKEEAAQLEKEETKAFARLDALEKKIGAEPPVAPVGEPIEIKLKSGGTSLFWRDGLKAEGDTKLETLSETEEENMTILVQRETGEFRGQGSLNLDFLAYHWLGFDLSKASKATLETLRLPPRVLMPFLILIIASFFTQRNSREALNRYYAKMKTEVNPDNEADRRELEKSYRNPGRFESRRIFPGSDLEFTKPRSKDVLGFAAAVAVCFVVVGILVWLAGIGA